MAESLRKDPVTPADPRLFKMYRIKGSVKKSFPQGLEQPQKKNQCLELGKKTVVPPPKGSNARTRHGCYVHRMTGGGDTPGTRLAHVPIRLNERMHWWAVRIRNILHLRKRF